MNRQLRFDAKSGQLFTLDEYIEAFLPALPNAWLLEAQWLQLPVCKPRYDSEADTLKHIKRVNELLQMAATELLRRGNVHDNSKLASPEKEFFDKFTPLLKDSTYGGEEYKVFLRQLKPALDHHYENNSHHPEHYPNGVDNFCLFDLMEMLLDWTAASERHNDGSIFNSIQINKERFGLSDQLVSILWNTATRHLI